MAVHRIRDPLGIHPDLIRVDLTDGDGPEEMAAIIEILDAGDPSKRLERVRRHPSLQAKAAQLAVRLNAVGWQTDNQWGVELATLEGEALWLDVAPRLARDHKGSRGRSKAGKKRGEQLRAKGDNTAKRVEDRLRQFEAVGEGGRGVAKRIANALNMPTRTVSYHLQGLKKTSS